MNPWEKVVVVQDRLFTTTIFNGTLCRNNGFEDLPDQESQTSDDSCHDTANYVDDTQHHKENHLK